MSSIERQRKQSEIHALLAVDAALRDRLESRGEVTLADGTVVRSRIRPESGCIAGRRDDLIAALSREGWNARAVDHETVLASRSGRMPRMMRVTLGSSTLKGVRGLDVFASSARKVGAFPQVGCWPAGRGDPQFVDQKDFPR